MYAGFRVGLRRALSSAHCGVAVGLRTLGWVEQGRALSSAHYGVAVGLRRLGRAVSGTHSAGGVRRCFGRTCLCAFSNIWTHAGH